ncbi:MAG: TIR domain-containing protein [candidate division KSB1 bacterium]|nr:TIR domain-containing protein [candidate division KSB1 bacterium]MDZ7365020.1 TIR domain-containing protein [candidate division KSB1 bacterium]MDZ7403415.1 TIR domain-containing protein [candidate division KSB1 bacterium]
MDKPRIFISHAWEDKALVRQLEKALADAGAEVWVDHAGIRGGDNLPERINDALEWCNTLLLVWSKQAKASHWVKLEWTNAISLRKLIIPCLIDGTPAPPIMANTAFIDFSNREQGSRELLRALQLAQTGGKDLDTASELAGVIHARLTQAAPPAIPKPPQDEPQAVPLQKKPPVSEPTPAVRPTIIQLRHTPITSLSVEAVQQMLRQKDFFDKYWNVSGKGIRHQYKRAERRGAKLVIDHTTGLTWQQSGSKEYLNFKDAEAYIRQLKAKDFGGYNDWRLPTLEEAMSLMEREKKNGDLYIDPVFDRQQWWIWTADKASAGRAWYLSFGSGFCDHVAIGDVNGVRAVRS